MIENAVETGELVCKSGDVIFREGAYGSGIYRILSGAAAVYANYEKDDQKLLTELHAGDYFGEMAVIEITRRSATVVAAADDTHVEVIDASDLSGYLDEHRGAINGLARHLSRRLRELTGDYTEVCDTLRELGRLDRSHDGVSLSLMERIKKFARVCLLGGEPEEAPEPSPFAAQTWEKSDRSLALEDGTYQKGEVIFREGERSECMYYIHEGRVGIYTGYGTKQQKLLTELSPEMFFGEMGLFEGLQRTATAVALEDGTCTELLRERDLDTLYAKNPAMALMVLQHLSGRLRRLTVDYLKACRTLADAEKDIKDSQEVLSPEAFAQAEYMSRLLLAPEVLY